MWLNDYQNKATDTLLSLIWDQWVLMGLSGNLKSARNWIVDPEALVLCTLLYGRYDPRLFDEMLDWLVENERWIVLQRLRNLSARWDDTIQLKILSAISNWMESYDRKGRWKRFLSTSGKAALEQMPLFVSQSGASLPMISEPDRDFLQAGILRPPIELRKLSGPIPIQTPQALIIRLRAIFGLSPRAEIVTYLFSHGPDSAAGIAVATGYSRPSVQDVLSDLLAGGILSMHKDTSQKVWSIDRTALDMGFILKGPAPSWVNWTSVFKAWNELICQMRRISSAHFNEYMLRSNLIGLNEQMGMILSDSEQENPFAKFLTLDQVMEEFPQRVDIFLHLF